MEFYNYNKYAMILMRDNPQFNELKKLINQHND